MWPGAAGTMPGMELSHPDAADLPLTAPDHPALSLLPESPTEDEIERFSALLLAVEAEHGMVDLSTREHISGGVYGRSVVIKAGTFLVGARHLEPGLAVCVGDITVWHNGVRNRLTGAHILQTAPGGHRVGFAHADTTWLTVHAIPAGASTSAEIEAGLFGDADQLMTRRAARQGSDAWLPV